MKLQEIMEEYQILLDKIKGFDLAKKLKKELEILREDDSFQASLKKYKKTFSEEEKVRLFTFSAFREYKRLENEVNFLILECNQEWKRLKGEKNCESD
ncbi:MAG TPA: hypothetical protein IAC24_02145 [Candidatus Onthousia faecigallinarum]|nr:hypothetical protein [Candidatus Onthousia faecigallinarum]